LNGTLEDTIDYYEENYLKQLAEENNFSFKKLNNVSFQKLNTCAHKISMTQIATPDVSRIEQQRQSRFSYQEPENEHFQH